MGGPRSNYSRLPQEIRSRILFLRFDGAEYDEIRKDPEIEKACRERGIALNNSTFVSVAFKRDLADFSARARMDEAARRADKIAQSVISSDRSMEDLTDVARYELAKALRKALTELQSDDDAEHIKSLRSLAQSIASVSNQHQANRIAALQRSLDDRETKIAGLKAEIEKLKADHEAELAALRGESTAADPAEVADRLDNMLGLKTPGRAQGEKK
jgi:hypothetical protein